MMLRILSVVAFAALMVGCSSSDSAKGSASALDMHTWEVVQVGAKGLELVPEEERPTLKFDSGKKSVTGSTGCNTFDGGFTMDEKGFKFGPTATTKKACEDMSVESAFLSALQKTARIDVNNAMLKLISADGVELLEATPQAK